MHFKLPSEIAAKIIGTGASRTFKIMQSKLEKTESVILINNIAYLVKFDAGEKKMDLYETIDLMWLSLKYGSLRTVGGAKLWSFSKIVDFQIIDKRIMAGVVYISNLRNNKV